MSAADESPRAFMIGLYPSERPEVLPPAPPADKVASLMARLARNLADELRQVDGLGVDVDMMPHNLMSPGSDLPHWPDDPNFPWTPGEYRSTQYLPDAFEW